MQQIGLFFLKWRPTCVWSVDETSEQSWIITELKYIDSFISDGTASRTERSMIATYQNKNNTDFHWLLNRMAVQDDSSGRESTKMDD